MPRGSYVWRGFCPEGVLSAHRGYKSRWRHTQNGDIPKWCMSPATIQLDLYTKLIQNAVLTCIQNGDNFKTATLKIKLDFIRRTIQLIYEMVTFKKK